jgi:hypothetical protein
VVVSLVAANAAREQGWTVDQLLDKELPDAVVIRLQDIFADTALYNYANAIQTQIEMLRAMRVEHLMEDDMVGDYDSMMKRLEDIRDYFFGKANQSRNLDYRKIPD